MLDKKPTGQLDCPVCKQVCKVPAGADSLPNNLHALHIIQLNNTNKKLSNILQNGQ